MFTGIIQSKGLIKDIEQTGTGIVLTIDLGKLNTEAIQLGDSIAVNGTCLTVISIDSQKAEFDVSDETLSKCLIDQWQVNDEVNLELALTLQTPLGGHLVSGHVDGQGVLTELNQDESYCTMTFNAPPEIGRFIATKGSITVNGVSLTSNSVWDSEGKTYFSLMLVPHTLQETTLGNLKINDKVHLEIDLIARYLDRMMTAEAKN